MPPCLFRRWQFTIHLIIIILVNMSLFRYFGREKVKAVGDNNNLEATKKDDDQSNATATGVAKSTAELGKAQESSRKRCRTFQETWKTRRPWLKFDEKENAMFCSYCRQFSKDKSAFGSEKTTRHRLVKTFY